MPAIADGPAAVAARAWFKDFVFDPVIMAAFLASPVKARAVEWSSAGMDGYGVLSALNDFLSDPSTTAAILNARPHLTPLALQILRKDIAEAMRRMIQ